MSLIDGAWLERLVRDQEVAGSNPVTPTPNQGGPERPSIRYLEVY